MSGESSISLTGTLDRSGQQDLTVQLDSVPLAGLADLAGMQRVQGMVDGRFTVTGPAAQPALNGDLTASVNGADLHVGLEPG